LIAAEAVPITTERDEARGRTIVTVTGDVTVVEVVAFLQEARKAPMWVTDDILIDLQFGSVTDITSEDARQIAMHAAVRRSGRTAFVAAPPMYGVARVFAAYRTDAGATVQIFHTREAAEAWLG
jgi:hypothetical protein